MSFIKKYIYLNKENNNAQSFAAFGWIGLFITVVVAFGNLDNKLEGIGVGILFAIGSFIISFVYEELSPEKKEKENKAKAKIIEEIYENKDSQEYSLAIKEVKNLIVVCKSYPEMAYEPIELIKNFMALDYGSSEIQKAVIKRNIQMEYLVENEPEFHNRVNNIVIEDLDWSMKMRPIIQKDLDNAIKNNDTDKVKSLRIKAAEIGGIDLRH